MLYLPDKHHTPAAASTDTHLDMQHSLKALLDQSGSSSSHTQWTFNNVLTGSKSAQAYTKFACFLAIHDVQWTGTTGMNKQSVPKEWKIFLGPLWSHFHDHFFTSTSTTKDAMDWLYKVYGQDLQVATHH